MMVVEFTDDQIFLSQHKLRPTADTYTALMVGYAEKGNLDGIKEVMLCIFSYLMYFMLI